MKTSSPEQPPLRKPSILLIGPPGGGKTTLMLQFPKVGVVNADDNLVGPDRFLREVRKLKTAYKYETVPFLDDGTSVPIEQCFDRVLSLLEVLKKDSEVETVCVDSLTWCNEYIIRKVLDLQKRKEMEARDWIGFKSKFLELLAGVLRGMGKTTVCTVHESIVYEPDPKNIIGKLVKGYEPSVQGSIVDYFGAFFTDVWRMEALPGPAKSPGPGMLPQPTVKYIMTTNRTAKSDLKNSFGLPYEITNPTFDELNKYIRLA